MHDLTGMGFNKEHTIIWSRNYNLMGNNSSCWPENLKSKVPPMFGKHLPLTSYSGFPTRFLVSYRTNRYMERFSLPYPHRYAVARQIVCPIRTYGSALVRFNFCRFNLVLIEIQVFIFCHTNRYMEPHRYAAAGQIACRIRIYGISA